MFHVGGKQLELSQRKSSHLSGQINFNDSLGMKIYPIDLEDANYEVFVLKLRENLVFIRFIVMVGKG